MLRFLTAGESHGRALLAILEGMPAGLKINEQSINQELSRRQSGYGRGKRMKIERDKIKIICGLKKSYTLGSPIGLCIENKDFSIERLPKVVCPRPGHADLAGVLKYGFGDIRNVLERASARETAVRVALGAICKLFLREFKIKISSRVLTVGGKLTPGEMKKKIIKAKSNQDTVGGIFEVMVKTIPCGLGSYVHWDRRIDARVAAAIMSIPGIKAVEIGAGFRYAKDFGSSLHDAIYYSKTKGFHRQTNNAGGIEGGVTNGEPLVVRACMKPIATLMKPLDSVNIITKKSSKANVERSDICVVQAAAVIAENSLAYVISDCLLEKFGADCLGDIKDNYRIYLKRISEK